MFLKGIESSDLVRKEESLVVWGVDSHEQSNKALVVLVIVEHEEDVRQYFFLGDDGIVKVVQNMNDEEMSNLVCHHLLKWLLDGLNNDLTVLCVQYVE